MKKMFMTFAAVLCCVMISTVFTSCSKDDDDSVSNYAAYTVNPIHMLEMLRQVSWVLSLLH